METLLRIVGHCLAAYLKSADFWSKAESTQYDYRRVVGLLDAEIGHVPLADVSRAKIREWKDRWAPMGHRAATVRLQVLKNALSPEMMDRELPDTLFYKVQRVERPHEAPEQNVAWTDEEFELVLTTCRMSEFEGLVRALVLARYAGMRRQDICDLRNDARYVLTLRGGHQQKRLRYLVGKSGIVVDLVEDPRLTEWLDTTTELPDYVAYNKYGLGWKARQLNQALDRVLERCAKFCAIRSNLTLHGLRHTRGVELAYAGLSDAEIMAQLGHADEQSARVYRRQAQRRMMADRGQRLVNQKRYRDERKGEAEVTEQTGRQLQEASRALAQRLADSPQAAADKPSAPKGPTGTLTTSYVLELFARLRDPEGSESEGAPPLKTIKLWDGMTATVVDKPEMEPNAQIAEIVRRAHLRLRGASGAKPEGYADPLPKPPHKRRRPGP